MKILFWHQSQDYFHVGSLYQEQVLWVVGTAAALALLGDNVIAQPNKGGTLKMGLGGGESTNSLDPATSLSQYMFFCEQNLW